MEMNYCRRCGKSLVQENAHTFHCANGHTIFANSSPTVGIFFVTNEGDVLLSKRGIEPHKGMLDSFGGFADYGEDFEEAAIRELREELSLEPEEYEPLRYLTSGVGHYPYQEETHTILSVFFWTRLKTDRQLTASDDVAAIQSFPLHEVNMEQLHDDDIRKGMIELQEIFQKEGVGI